MAADIVWGFATQPTCSGALQQMPFVQTSDGDPSPGPAGACECGLPPSAPRAHKRCGRPPWQAAAALQQQMKVRHSLCPSALQRPEHPRKRVIASQLELCCNRLSIETLRHAILHRAQLESSTTDQIPLQKFLCRGTCRCREHSCQMEVKTKVALSLARATSTQMGCFCRIYLGLSGCERWYMQDASRVYGSGHSGACTR